MPVSEHSVRAIRDLPSLLQFLERELQWKLPPNPTLEEATFEWSASELRLNEAAQRKLSGGLPASQAGTILQLRPMTPDQPWGIFIVNFTDGQLYKTALRQVLRGLVPKRRRDSTLPAWKHENLLFICTTRNQEFTFAHFRGEKPERAKLIRFSWSPDEPIRTLCEFNLPALRMPEDPSTWVEQWSKAFDVEKVTNEFFKEYRRVFENAEKHIRGIKDDNEKRLFTQKLFNRLLFIRFLEKKGWLSINKRQDYIRALWEDYKKDATKESNFYRERLRPLFFHALNAPNEVNQIGINRGGFIGKLVGQVPYLNGGLFEQDESDQNESILVPDKAIEPAIQDLFYHFNFTVTESTPLDVDVAVDPEMLGRIFEELVTGRHETGSYYTPRTVVSFMCREAIKGYLGGYEQLVEERDASDISVPQARELLAKLTKVVIVDPACGSGAYLLGMLHELHALTQLLDTRTDRPSAKDDYERKLNIIQNNLYGVDIDPFATNIARLRLWLSLAVEYEGSDPPPLPNLDFKIEVGDSLTAPNPQELPDLFRSVLLKHADTIAELKARHMRAHHEEKKRLTNKVLEEEKSLAKALQDHPQDETSFDWRVRFAEVFRNDGFDIVLANPPYGLKCEDPLRFQYFSRVKGEDPQSKDSYGLFMARALQLLKPGGFFTYIVSDTWRTIRTHRPLRKLLLTKTTVLHVLDLPSWIFKATVNTCILSLLNKKAPPEHTLIAGDLRNLPAGDWETLEANLAAVSAHAIDVQTTTYARYTYPQALIGRFSNLSFFIASPKIAHLMRDVGNITHEGQKGSGQPPVYTVHFNNKTFDLVKLGEIGEVKKGLATGDNFAYYYKKPEARGSYNVYDESKVLSPDELKKLTLEERLHGINPDDHSGRFLVPLDKGEESNIEESWLPNYYTPPRYFIDWSRKAVKRIYKMGGMRNPEHHFKQGIAFSWTGFYAPTFRLNLEGVFDQSSSCIFQNRYDRYYLLGVLCSKVIRYLTKNFADHTVNSTASVIEKIVIPYKQTEQQISKLAKDIVEKQKENQYYDYFRKEQRVLDNLVYQLYSFSDEDIREVELWYCRRYPLLAEAQGVLAEVKEKYAAHLARCERILSKPPRYWKSHPILKLIAQGEGPKLEFKETLEHNVRTDQRDAGVLNASLKTIAAFLNTEGGTLLIGVSDNGEIKGLERDYPHCHKHDKDGFEQKLHNLLSSRFTPAPLGNVVIRFEQLPEGEICVVEVKPLNKPEIVHMDKEVYVRDGNTTRKLEGPDLTRWVAERAKG